MEVFIGLNFKPFYAKHHTLYCVMGHWDGKIRLLSLGTLNDKVDITNICENYKAKRFSFNLHYGDKGKYKLPKLRAKFYIDRISSFILEVKKRELEPIPIFSSSVYGPNNLPSGELLEGLNFRFRSLEKYISNLDINPFKFDWKVHPVDVLDVIATALGLYFYSVGKFEMVDFEGFKVVRVSWK